MTSFKRSLLMLPVLALGACAVAPPSHPTIVSLPGPGKSFPQFQSDDALCQSYASSKTSDAQAASAASQNNAVGTATAGALIGAAAGAALGSLSGNVGAGAGIGAGIGLLGGASVAGDNTQGTANSLQGRFDTAYAQCMVGNGETIEPPSGPAYDAAPVAYPYPAVIVGPGY
jgi:hypothetical protein